MSSAAGPAPFVDGTTYSAGVDYSTTGFYPIYSTGAVLMTKANWTTISGLNAIAALPLGSQLKIQVPAPPSNAPIYTIITLTSAWIDNGTTYDATAAMPDAFNNFYAYSVTMNAA